jgi:hypothetical protein
VLSENPENRGGGIHIYLSGFAVYFQVELCHSWKA